MSLACAAPDPAQAIAERLADYLDCRAQALGQTGFQALSHGWLGPAVLGGCLTIYVGLIGYRLLLGRPFGPRDALLAVLRAGTVIAFATSWPAYEAVVYRLAIDGPAELSAQALLPSGVTPLSLPEAAKRLDQDYAALPAPVLVPVTAPSTQTSAQPVAQAGQPQTPAQPQQQQPSSPADTFDPASTRPGLALTISTIGALAAVRLAAGFLLALGPLIITLALFDTALGVFEGWVRALAATFVAAVGTTIVAAFELDFIESQLTQTSHQTGLGEPALMATALLFGAAMIAVLIGAMIVGRGFRIRTAGQASPIGLGGAADGKRFETRRSPSVEAPSEPVSRARGVADAVVRLGQRQRTPGADVAPVFGQFARSHGLVADDRSGDRDAAGQVLRRRTARPQTASAKRRDNLQ